MKWLLKDGAGWEMLLPGVVRQRLRKTLQSKATEPVQKLSGSSGAWRIVPGDLPHLEIAKTTQKLLYGLLLKPLKNEFKATSNLRSVC